MRLPGRSNITSIRPPVRGESMADSLEIFRKSLAIRMEAWHCPGTAELDRSRPR